MSNWTTLCIILALMGYCLLFSALVARNVRNFYRTTHSPEAAVRRLEVINRYVHPVLSLAVIFYCVYLIVPHLGSGIVDKILVVVHPIVLICVAIIGHQLILHSVVQEVRQTTDTKWEQAGSTVRFLALIYTPIMLYYIVVTSLPDQYRENIMSSTLGKLLIPILFMVLVYMIQPLFLPRTLKATPMEDSEMKDRFLTYARKARVGEVEFYLWPTTRQRTANVLVSGYLKKQILIADYLLDQCTEEEIQSVIGHEFGHIKRHHLLIRLLLMIAWPPLIQLISFLGDKYAPNAPEWVILPTLLTFCGLYFGLFYLLVSRIHERQADSYALRLGIDPATFANALVKMAKLNHMNTSQKSRITEAVQTHPSISRRIHWIMKEDSLGMVEMLGGDSK